MVNSRLRHSEGLAASSGAGAASSAGYKTPLSQVPLSTPPVA